MGVLITITIIYLSLQVFKDQTPIWLDAILIYLVFSISNSMFSSLKDLEGTLAFSLLLLAIALATVTAVYLLGYSQTVISWLMFQDFSFLINVFTKIDIYLAIPLVIDLVLIIVLGGLLSLKKY